MITTPSTQATDWDAVRAAYVTGSESARQLADRFKVSASALSKRATRGEWAQERHKVSKNVHAIVTAKTVDQKAARLSKLNQDHLTAANDLRDRATRMLKTAKSPHTLRALAGVFEAAQRIGRIALGADADDPDVDDVPMLPLTVTIERRDCRKRANGGDL